MSRCDAHIMLMDDRWGAFRDQCEGEAGHDGDHFYVMTATMPLGRLVWPQEEDAGRLCADGSLVHDFKGQPRCPACGWDGHERLTPEQISVLREWWTVTVAQWFHEVYESLAGRHGWETQEASRKAWDDLPPENKTLMLATVQEVLGRLMLAGWTPPEPCPPHDFDLLRQCRKCGLGMASLRARADDGSEP